MNKKKAALILVGVAVLAVATSGLRTNPPVERTVDWTSPQATALFYRACADCHSNETNWPWYSYVAPISWRVIHHTNEGREHFNISANDLGHADDAAEALLEGEMPLSDYLRFHPEARLTPDEKSVLAEELKLLFGDEEEGSDHGEGHGDHDHD